MAATILRKYDMNHSSVLFREATRRLSQNRVLIIIPMVLYSGPWCYTDLLPMMGLLLLAQIHGLPIPFQTTPGITVAVVLVRAAILLQVPLL